MICDIIDFVMSAIMNFKLTQLLFMYKRTKENSLPNVNCITLEEFERLFETGSEDGKILDLDNQGGTLLVPILFDLLQHRYPPLVNKATSLLLKFFKYIFIQKIDSRDHRKREDLLHAVKEVQLFITADSIALYKKSFRAIRILNSLQQTSEVWLTTQEKAQKIQNAEKEMEYLLNACDAPEFYGIGRGSEAQVTL